MYRTISVLMIATLCRVIHAEEQGYHMIKDAYKQLLTRSDGYCDSHFLCHSGGKKSGSLVCVAANKVCNGEHDCMNGADEHNCPPNCGILGMTYCKDGRTCARICDGVNDCLNGEDEKDCPTQCAPSEYLCMDGVTCLTIGQLCDGKAHCPMGDDEMECSSQCSCPEGHYLCRDGKTCIPAKKVCDSIRGDCPYDDDESQCPSGCKCSDGEYQCQGGNACIERSKLCDEIQDCPLNDDEGDVICARWWDLF